MKYFQEFSITPEVVDLIKQYKVENTIASNLANRQSYALGLNTLEIINKIENTLVHQVEVLKVQAEESVENLADEIMGIVDISQINIQTDPDCQVLLTTSQEVKKLVNSQISRQQLIEEFLAHYPELMWVVKESSPLFSQDYQELVIRLQYYNYLINL